MRKTLGESHCKSCEKCSITNFVDLVVGFLDMRSGTITDALSVVLLLMAIASMVYPARCMLVLESKSEEMRLGDKPIPEK